MIGLETDLFVEFAKHGLNRTFTVFNATLRELPSMFPDTLTPKDLIFLINEDDSDIRTVAFAIKHGHS
jgi:hypothetical protein